MTATGIDMSAKELLAFARERHAIYLRRQAGQKKPLTNDEILLTRRFCNVYRELDTVTQWIAKHWRTIYSGDPDLWFAMTVARNVNWPDTLAEIGYPVPWRPKHFLEVMQERTRRKEKVYGGAYMLRSESDYNGKPKALYQVERMFNPFWERRRELRPQPGDTLNSYHMLLRQLYGMGSFMAGQVVADLKYVEPLKSAADWWTFACSGPGSRRGLNRVLGRPVKSPWTEEEWRLEHARLMEWFNPRWEAFGFERLHGQDIQNLCCETDKYLRVKLGEGDTRARYNGRGE